MSNNKSVRDWDANDVATLLQNLQLDTLIPEFKTNAVNGKDLIGNLTDAELKDELHCTPIQIKKIRDAIKESMAEAVIEPESAVMPRGDVGPFVKPVFRTKDIEAYLKLKAKIRQYEADQIDQKAADAWQRVRKATQEQNAVHKETVHAHEAEAKALERFEAVQKWYLGKYVLGKARRDAKQGKMMTKMFVCSCLFVCLFAHCLFVYERCVHGVVVFDLILF